MNFKNHFKDIHFDEETHTYTRNGFKYISVTTLIHDYASFFDAGLVSEKVSARDNIPKKEILSIWDIQKEYACILGKEFHLYVETYFKYGRRIQTVTGIEDRINEFHKFWDKFSDFIEIVDNEVVVYDDKTKVAGTIDCIAKNKKTGKYVILDWKTNKEIKEHNQWNNMKFPFEQHDDCNLNHYSMQLDIYKRILEKNVEGIELENSRIIYFPKNNDYRIIKTKNMSQEAETILNRNVSS
jgi:hypothetical protein